MTGPPVTRPPQTDPGGIQARADGQQVELRTYDGELIKKVSPEVADELVRNNLADDLKHCLRVKLGIRCLPPRFDRVGGHPDLEQMKRRDPDRYAELWRGNADAHAGKGALGRRVVDSTIHLGPTRRR
jgi:hypothetical protein